MPNEEIDKLVRDAASQHHPPYDDKAWGKMEAMLDKHLPQKKDRRKPVIFLLSFLLLGGAAFWGIKNALHNNTVVTTAQNTTATAVNEKNKTTPVPETGEATSTPAPGNTGSATAGNTLPDDQQAGSTSTSASINTTATTTADNGTASGTVKNNAQKNTPDKNSNGKYFSNNNDAYAAGKKNGHNQKGRTSIKVKRPGTGEEDGNTAKVNTVAEKTDGADNTVSLTEVPVKDAAIENGVVPLSKTTAGNSVNETKPAAEKNTPDKNTTAATATTSKKSNKSFSDKLSITVSAGADLSYVELNNAGKLKPAFGAGLSYALGKHITVASGLYVSKKVYTALPYQYKFGGYAYPNLKEIGADCKVFEIPVSVYYNFKQVKNHSWLAGISLSSLLMKRESYDYRYETPTGQYYNYEKTLTNENKHYFSVLTLSAGYQYKLSNRLSFIAEPYLKVPLAGIGLGKIKLNSTGILVTAAIKPFTKKRK
jgi:hypothetical protein